MVLERLNAYIQTHGMRPSPVREAVLEQACSLPQPFTAEQLRVVCEAMRISVGTVYNSLNLFVLAQILHATNRQRGGRAATEYEVVTPNVMRMQYICTECSRTVDFHDKAIERIVRERRYSNFAVNTFSLFVYGQCKICRSKKPKKST